LSVTEDCKNGLCKGVPRKWRKRGKEVPIPIEESDRKTLAIAERRDTVVEAIQKETSQ
jgi:hypothetical protein